MKYTYSGCDNAASATAKLVSTSTYDYSKKTIFFGDTENAIKSYAVSCKVDEFGHFPLYYHEFFVKDLDTNDWVEVDVDDELIENIWASCSVNPANRVR